MLKQQFPIVKPKQGDDEKNSPIEAKNINITPLSDINTDLNSDKTG